MIRLLNAGQSTLAPIEFEELLKNPKKLDGAIWVDMLNPTDEEELFVETQLGLEILTKEEMHEIEESSRLFEVKGAICMSCWLIAFDGEIPENKSVAFVMTRKHLVSIRHSDHHPFSVFCTASKRVKSPPFHDSAHAFVEILDTILNQVASTLRHVEQKLNKLSLQIFASEQEMKASKKRGEAYDLKDVVQELGKCNSLVNNLRESVVSFQNITPFFLANSTEWLEADDIKRLNTLERDTRSLREYDAQLSAEMNFLLDSTVGLISIQQNQSMKVLSVAALLLAFI
ncbi:MAG: CorA family divalent cation transporter [Verrucomicrobiota bacterium]